MARRSSKAAGDAAGRTLEMFPDAGASSLDEVLGGATVVPRTDGAAATSEPSAHVAAGRRAHAMGKALEQWLYGQHAAAVLCGLLAWWHHVPPGVVYKMRRCTKCGVLHQELVWAAKATADFVAMAGAKHGARPIVIEAKSVEGPSAERARYYLRDLPDHQRTHLEATAAHGGLALLVVEFRVPGPPGFAPMATTHAVPWRDVPWRSCRAFRDAAKRSPSIGPDDVGAFRVPHQGIYLGPLLRG